MSDKLVDFNKTQNKALKLRIYPTESQIQTIESTFGACRFIYNNYLDEKIEFYTEHILPVKKTSSKEELNQIYKTFKRTSDKEYGTKYPWMKETSSTARHEVCRHLDAAYKRFYDNLKSGRKVSKKRKNGKRKNPYGFPQYKSKKDNKQSYSDRITEFNFDERYVVIPKCGKVSFAHDKQLPDWFEHLVKLNGSCTVSRTASDRYYISILFTHNDFKYVMENRKDAIGLDFDCDDGYIDSESKSARLDYGFVKQKQSVAKKLKRLQNKVRRRKRYQLEDKPYKINSKNREKARTKLARLEEKIACRRQDWIEKETLRLVQNYNSIGIEDLNIKAMSIGSRNAKNYVDISWGTFVNKLEQKAVKYDCKVVKADRFFASSQTCNVCGFKNIKVKEKHLENWKCPSCGTQHQRDINAAINLKKMSTVGTTGIYAHGDSDSGYIASLAVQALAVVEVGNTVGDPVYEASTL